MNSLAALAALPPHPALSMLLVIAFCVAWVVCVGAWIYALVEHGRLRRADGRVFTSGLLVHRFRDPELWQVRGSAQLSTFDLPAGRVVPLSAERIGFLPSVGGAFELRSSMRSLLLYSGEISWMDGPAAVSIRAPLGIPLFMGAWIAGWLIFALGLGPAIECSGSGAGCGREAGRTLLVQVLPALVVIVGAFFGVLGIRRRARLLYAEVRSALRTRAQPAVP